jgi:CheY-like chemotaxis protein
MTARRVLIVDDDPLMVETLCDILELRGWKPSRALDGAEAIAFCERGVDVVVMDVRMPRMDGVTALRAIKRCHPGLPVVLVTAMASDDALEQARREGAFRILRKPIDLPLLLEVLEQAI